MFQKLLGEPKINHDWDSLAKISEVEEFLDDFDSIHQIRLSFFDKFISEYSPQKEAVVWAKTYLDVANLWTFASYPTMHRKENNLTREDWNPDWEFFESFPDRFQLDDSMLISGFAVNKYLFSNLYLGEKNQRSSKYRYYIGNGGHNNVSEEKINTYLIQQIIKNADDPLLKQLILTRFFSSDFFYNETNPFEDNF